MKDAELRGKLLKHFYDLCDKNGRWVPVTEIIVAPDLMSREAIANACQHLADADLVRWELFTPCWSNTPWEGKDYGLRSRCRHRK
jgi:hypothetical protein